MSSLEQQIQDLFKDFPHDIQQVLKEVIRIEQDNIHLDRPRVKDDIHAVLERIARETLKDTNDAT